MQRLNPANFRIHRSVIVNINRIAEVQRQEVKTMLVLRDGVQVSVNRRRRIEMRRLLQHDQTFTAQTLLSPVHSRRHGHIWRQTYRFLLTLDVYFRRKRR